MRRPGRPGYGGVASGTRPTSPRKVRQYFSTSRRQLFRTTNSLSRRPLPHRQGSRLDNGKNEINCSANPFLVSPCIARSTQQVVGKPPHTDISTRSYRHNTLSSTGRVRKHTPTALFSFKWPAHCRSKCLTITIKVLAQSLDTNLDRCELLKLINGILKLSTIPHNLLINNRKDNRHQDLSPRQCDGSDSNDPVLKHHEYTTERTPATQQSSLNLPSRCSSSTNSSNAALSLSLKSQKMYDDSPSGQTSYPPTLRNLLGPLHAQIISSKRPHTPRTAHRLIIDQIEKKVVNFKISIFLSSLIVLFGFFFFSLLSAGFEGGFCHI
ncbi:hypothetical protein VP01_1773g3 [Puccinia sorghi]|uniref:Uncharacterized protein n=1 Tax=Puccinia sorghi TaxID=27349 RepID=A0A0L6VEQ0_9BASI|nr:hypothetical protein VP01_1773g3 [Puccinia sorghi]